MSFSAKALGSISSSAQEGEGGTGGAGGGKGIENFIYKKPILDKGAPAP